MDTWKQSIETVYDEKKIYLAGTIYTEEPHKSWKYEFRNSMSGKISNKISFSYIDPNPNTENNEFSKKVVVPIDKQIISSSDILIAYIVNCSFGTTMEIFYAFQQQNKLVIVIDPYEKYGEDVWLKYHTHLIVNNIEQASLVIYNTYDNIIIN